MALAGSVPLMIDMTWTDRNNVERKVEIYVDYRPGRRSLDRLQPDDPPEWEITGVVPEDGGPPLDEEELDAMHESIVVAERVADAYTEWHVRGTD